MLRKFLLSFQDDVLLFLDLLVEVGRLVVLFRDGVGIFARRGGRLLRLQRLRDVVLQ